MKNIILLVLLSTLVACKATPSNPIIAAEAAGIEIEEIDEPNEKIHKVQYLAKTMMGSEQRQIYTKMLLEEEVENWTPTNVGAGFVGASILESNPFTSTGVNSAMNMTLALDVMSFMFDGSSDRISQYWMPGTDDKGNALSLEEATKLARETVTNKMLMAFEHKGIQLTCYSGCEQLGTHRIYVADLTEKLRTKLSQEFGFAYVPSTVQVKASLWPMLEIKTDDPVRDIALGFTPKYYSGYNGFGFELTGGKKVDESGNAILLKEKSAPEVQYFEGEDYLIESAFGRSIMRDFTTDLPFIFGERRVRKGKYIVNGGKVYDFSISTASSFIDGVVIN